MYLPGVVAHAFDPSTREAEAGRFLSSRTARATQRNPVLKNKTKQKGMMYLIIYCWVFCILVSERPLHILCTFSLDGLQLRYILDIYFMNCMDLKHILRCLTCAPCRLFCSMGALWLYKTLFLCVCFSVSVGVCHRICLPDRHTHFCSYGPCKALTCHT